MDQIKSYVFKWDNFDKVLAFNFYSYLIRGKYSDCSLVTEQKIVSAHKIVLSAVSPFFEQIFDFNSSNDYLQKQMVVINEVPYEILQYVLEFAYKGRVSVEGENYGRFCKAAKLLKLKGIADKDLLSVVAPSKSTEFTPLKISAAAPAFSFPSPPSTPRQSTSPVIQDFSLDKSIASASSQSPVLTVKSEPISEPRKARKSFKRKASSLEEAASPEIKEEQVEKKRKSLATISPCQFCDKPYSKSSMYAHAKNCKLNPDRVTFACEVCNKELSRPDKLIQHMKLHDKSRLQT